MSELYLYNSLTKKKERFEPINSPKVGMYTCGPTVYDYQHIGNFRTMTLSDIIRRVLEFNEYSVKSVRNITDIDDKTIKGASEKNVPLAQFTKRYSEIFFEDLKKLNIQPVDVNPKATDYIKEMIKYIDGLIAKGLAYVEKDGSVYFDISEFKNYGKLSGVKNRSLETGKRVLSDEYTKDNVQDFALWKSVRPDGMGYISPWGKGRPGWHIECSVMSQKHLGDTFDIHVGGIDLLFPHHENEIAQSEGKTGKKFVNYFIHGEFLLVDANKMSKSKNNFYTVADIEKRGFEPMALRYLYLSGHYRSVLNFTWEALEASQTALKKLRDQILAARMHKQKAVLSEEKRKKTQVFAQEFQRAINDDLSTPKALAVLWQALKSNISSEDKYDLLLSFDEVLGLRLKEVSRVSKVPKAVKKLVSEREEYRREKNFEKADKVRKLIEVKGYIIRDTEKGVEIIKS